ncbi:Energy-conserving hydrogenase (ferredoxin), subunit D [Dehalobacter sp. UNSWDHB]|jgi:Respiratory-chain NADH dehydrogenase, 30 Kd subunit.|uniref:NADH-quinone oxidoreductase subunit C n=1 Tax=unclassified Dehalobacter TaxID=2635733 RepID=UPI00028AC1C9|nr:MULTISPECIES: NADH-quinone oxidoreductase subunit C [unclassified Dehalobacter]AFV03251.1 Energy-conserving hydrogenase (ferredoxin), subunit D [Dehalobacter sp. DCA]AFV06237.1 Energy-conserving hydrogenase (ferredoxin), subunit D [Dehalobacter sp. CF]EQB21012.1 Energy-conserving hydrogenase (ferredoxin), subunit D [Dehalobacter sp. UNSWDHB]
MSSEQVILDTQADNLKDTIKSYKDKGYRMIQMHCTKADPELDLYYSLENRKMDLVNLRLPVCSGMNLPSISGIFLCAFLYENELHDLFGLNFMGIAVDYQGKLYQMKVKTPFQETGSSKGNERGVAEA